ncbi:hypothetical protein PGT21_008461 [Puccinia graminis f. sp. tritici]|uniref:Uncharacterized protein n=1 Tax=Puccinia graminis f. sp. tritici TaxID=56615 RepID=A0A5B0N5L4_PUCGR|nr:hypothetical protein PGTUg99_034057 [Puccinia graminis f. sp. tritici]KAA1094061.1 hypothetical protein PGT21_008461 [Puccinia graminis f. sp. tritici]
MDDESQIAEKRRIRAEKKAERKQQGVDKRTPAPLAHAKPHARCGLACAPARQRKLACGAARQ